MRISRFSFLILDTRLSSVIDRCSYRQERKFLEYFSSIDIDRISPVDSYYAGIGPIGYGTALVLARMIKVKERILSD